MVQLFSSVVINLNIFVYLCRLFKQEIQVIQSTPFFLLKRIFIKSPDIRHLQIPGTDINSVSSGKGLCGQFCASSLNSVRSSKWITPNKRSAIRDTVYTSPQLRKELNNGFFTPSPQGIEGIQKAPSPVFLKGGGGHFG
jgi:hypothetical protein